MAAKRKFSSTSTDGTQENLPKKLKLSHAEYITPNNEPFYGLPEDCTKLILQKLDYPALFRMFYVSKRYYQLSLHIFNHRMQTTYGKNRKPICILVLLTLYSDQTLSN
jgi:hypothetical protein